MNSEKKYGIAVSQHMHVVFEGDLYFSSNQYGTKFGKINLNTYEIEFVQNVEVESGVQIDKPLCYSNHLYLLDTAKTLHIFEKV
ncbi:hypothetical protein [Flavobacterium sp. NKUCC04_CG]|uniref:hypothetical protein n=1 Tax=Flavobacterium sp. NKUCC04_CG TaxID=2842121 RepID=UPI001C5B7DDE|nr:hypothetical protein [Flavobacterium sp. NKUCC04_CG]MBW3520013.1 hypothetical protein [Flavobacterium sp. NKUCC04_CG]